MNEAPLEHRPRDFLESTGSRAVGRVPLGITHVRHPPDGWCLFFGIISPPAPRLNLWWDHRCCANVPS